MQTKILYEDKEILVVQKPAGIAVQTSHIGQKDVVSELKNYLADGKPPYLGVIHRLDQPVEGVLVFAKTKNAAAVLSKQLQKEDFCKIYLAAVCGKPKETEGTLVDYLAKEQGSAVVVTDASQKSGAKKAVLHYKLLAETRFEGRAISLLHIRLETGRFHQIRAQLSYAGLPIWGDRKYGGEEEAAFARENGIMNPALCAENLSFVHPVTGRKMTYTAEPENAAFAFFKQDKK